MTDASQLDGADRTVTNASMDIYLPALPRISDSLSASPSLVQLTITSYVVGIAVGQLVIGPAQRRSRSPTSTDGRHDGLRDRLGAVRICTEHLRALRPALRAGMLAPPGW